MNITKKTKTLKSLKKRLKKSLPDKIMKVMQSYDDFVEQLVPDDAKGFSAHHTACKSAVVHAETLLKLARWTDDEVESDKEDDDINGLLLEARREIGEDDNEN